MTIPVEVRMFCAATSAWTTIFGVKWHDMVEEIQRIDGI
jgi:hypothetical protein